MILFVASTLLLTSGAWILLRPAPDGVMAADAGAAPPRTVSYDEASFDHFDDEDGERTNVHAVPIEDAEDAGWDDFLPPLHLRPSLSRPAASDPAPVSEAAQAAEEPQPDAAFDMTAFAAKLDADSAVLPRIEGFDADRDDLEIPLPPGAVGAVTTRKAEGGLAVIVDGEAVALLPGCAALDPDRIRLTAF